MCASLQTGSSVYIWSYVTPVNSVCVFGEAMQLCTHSTSYVRTCRITHPFFRALCVSPSQNFAFSLLFTQFQRIYKRKKDFPSQTTFQTDNSFNWRFTDSTSHYHFMRLGLCMSLIGEGLREKNESQSTTFHRREHQPRKARAFKPFTSQIKRQGTAAIHTQGIW